MIGVLIICIPIVILLGGIVYLCISLWTLGVFDSIRKSKEVYRDRTSVAATRILESPIALVKDTQHIKFGVRVAALEVLNNGVSADDNIELLYYSLCLKSDKYVIDMQNFEIQLTPDAIYKAVSIIKPMAAGQYPFETENLQVFPEPDFLPGISFDLKIKEHPLCAEN